MRKTAILIHKKSQAFPAELVRILYDRQSTNFKAAGKCRTLDIHTSHTLKKLGVA